MDKYNNTRLTITFSEAQTARYFEIVSGKLEAEVNEGILPSGATITIDLAPPFGNFARVNDNFDLGEVAIEFTKKHKTNYSN